MVDFKVHIRPGPGYHQRPSPSIAPPIPRGNMDPASRDPIRLWVGLDGTAVAGMWLKVLTAVVATVTSRPERYLKHSFPVSCRSNLTMYLSGWLSVDV